MNFDAGKRVQALDTAAPQITRRAALATGVVATLAAPVFIRDVRAQPRLRPTPAQTEGPFYPDVLPSDTDADLLVQGPVRYTQGQATWLQGTLTDTAGRALSGAVVEIWQCDHEGHYRHTRDSGHADPAFQGFGRSAVDSAGHYRFHTIRPVPYTGRTPHIHVKVKLGPRELLTTQLYVEGEPGNVRDGLWRSLGPADRAALTRPFVPGGDGLQARFAIVVEV